MKTTLVWITWVWNELRPKLQQLALNKEHLEKVWLNLAVTTWSLTMSPFLPEESPNSTKVNYSFHWKSRRDKVLILTDLDSPMAIFDFGHVQGVNLGQRPKTQTLGKTGHCKNLSSSKCFKWHLYNHEGNLWPKFQLDQTLTGIIAHKTPKCNQIGPEPTKYSGFLWLKLKMANT